MKHVLSILAITFLSINVASAALNSGEANYSSGISPITMTPKGSVSIEKYPVLTPILGVTYFLLVLFVTLVVIVGAIAAIHAYKNTKKLLPTAGP